MITLLSLNMEGERHTDRVMAFITKHKPDVICLQEIPSSFIEILAKLGYFSSFAPMLVGNNIAIGDCIGIAIATKIPTQSTTTYYASNNGTFVPYQREHSAETISNPVILATYESQDGQTYHIATAHQPVTQDGTADDNQIKDTKSLLNHLKTQPPHILCGDMNMPRGYNTNYDLFSAHYTDCIPETYSSSLDKSLHRLGSRNDLNAPIFDIYMVDYIFSQAPYTVSTVELHFGISDHAAVTAVLQK
jgi:endonuclease/exonuclease/phosphatase family metal-dependent hydrolase